MDAGKVTALTLLDLSATFDTIDHTFLLSILDDWFGVTGKALNWSKSYLTGRCQRIKIGDCLSYKAVFKFGVPQGSVLGPLLFTLYTTPLSSMMFEHTIPHHLNADDSHLYVLFASWDSAAALNGLHSCLASVQSSMSTNQLNWIQIKLNSSWLRTSDRWSKYLSMFLIDLLSVKTSPAKSARNLGVIFDNNFTFRSHIFVVCNSCFYHMRDCAVFVVTLIWIVQNYSLLLSCPVVLIIVSHLCMVLLTLISLGFSMYIINWSARWQSLLHLLAVFNCFVLFIGCQ